MWVPRPWWRAPALHERVTPAASDEEGIVYTQDFDPVAHSLGLTAIIAALPILTLIVLLGGVKMKAQWAAPIALVVAIVVATAIYGMPVDQAVLSAAEGAAFGLFPIMWIVVAAIWVYNMTVESGHFAVLRRSIAVGLGGSADPGGADRLLLRHADGGARRLRCPGGDHSGHAGRARLQADQGGRPRSAREHRGRPVRCDRDPDHDAVRGHGTRATGSSARWSADRRRCSA